MSASDDLLAQISVIATTAEQVADELIAANDQVELLTKQVAERDARIAELEKGDTVVPETYTVVAGDYLIKIVNKFKPVLPTLTVEQLKEWNGLTSSLIEIGQVLRLSPPVAPVLPSGHPAKDKSLAFVDDFDSLSVGQLGSKWAFTSNSYRYGHYNPDDNKRDWNTPEAMKVVNGQLVITATPNNRAHPAGGTYWNTGFLTTEPRNDASKGGSGFRLQAGDFYVICAAMPTGNLGAWPALWTWLPDAFAGAEVDPFEYHNDNPHLLEFGNAMGDKGYYWENKELVQPGKFVWIGILAGDGNNDFYVGDRLETMRKVWSDGYGLKGNRPHLIANLSVSAGRWHPSPQGNAPIEYKIDTVRVYR